MVPPRRSGEAASRASTEQSRRHVASSSNLEQIDASPPALSDREEEDEAGDDPLTVLEEGDVSSFLPPRATPSKAQSINDARTITLPFTTTPRSTPGHRKRLQLSPDPEDRSISTTGRASRRSKRTRTNYADATPERSVASSSHLIPRSPNNHLNTSQTLSSITPPRSPAMRVLGGLASIFSPFSRARNSAAFRIGEEQSEDQNLVEAVAREPLPDSDDEAEEGSDASMGSASLDETQLAHDTIPPAPLPPFPHTFGAASTLRRRSPEPAPESSQIVSGPRHFIAAARQSGPSFSALATLNVPEGQSSPPNTYSPATPHGAHNAGYSAGHPPLNGHIHLSSPLSRNYDLLSRFFAEKATLQGAGGPNASTGLSEIEIAGCMRLLEESMAAGRAGEIDRLREDALSRAGSAWSESNFSGYPVGPSGAGGDIDFVARRSPSLPLGAAAGEGWASSNRLINRDSATVSRPSSSFLAPSATGRSDFARPYASQPSQLRDYDATENSLRKSLATSFSQAALSRGARASTARLGASGSTGRRERRAYLGPGLGFKNPNALRTSRARPPIENVSLHEPLGRSRLQPEVFAASPTGARIDQQAEAGNLGEGKRRRTEGSNASAASALSNAGPLSSTSLLEGGTATASPSKPSSAQTASPSTRSATASAMLSILSSGPALPPPTRTKPAAPKEAINPYEMPADSFLGRSANGSPSSGAASSARSRRAAALQAAKEESRQRKLKAKDEAKAKEETALERIERTAPKPASSSRSVGTRSTKATDAAVESTQKETAALNAEEKARKRREATEEARRRMNEMMNKKTGATVKSPSVAQTRAEESAQKDDDDDNDAPPSEPTVRPTAPQPFAFGATQFSSKASPSAPVADQAPTRSTSAIEPKTAAMSTAPSPSFLGVKPLPSAFAPKKPSPLSLAAFAPESPSSSSETEGDEAARSKGHKRQAITSQAQKTNNSSSSLHSQDKGEPEEGEIDQTADAVLPERPEQNAVQSSFSFSAASRPASKPTPSTSSFSFTAPAQSAAPISDPSSTFAFTKPAGQPSAGSAVTPSSKMPAVSSPTSTSLGSGDPTSARQAALKASADALPSFDFSKAVHLVGEADSEDSSDTKAAKEKASQVALASLPAFTFTFKTPSTSVGLKISADASPTSVPSVTTDASSSQSQSSSEITAAPASDDAAAMSSNPQGLAEGEGEEDESTSYEVRGKIWKLASGTWADLGIANIRIKTHKDTGKSRLLARNEVTGKPIVNFNLYESLSIKLEKQVAVFTGFGEDGKPVNYRCKVKTVESAQELKSKLEESARAGTA